MSGSLGSGPSWRDLAVRLAWVLGELLLERFTLGLVLGEAAPASGAEHVLPELGAELCGLLGGEAGFEAGELEDLGLRWVERGGPLGEGGAAVVALVA